VTRFCDSRMPGADPVTGSGQFTFDPKYLRHKSETSSGLRMLHFGGIEARMGQFHDQPLALRLAILERTT
jgi:hypothetical protein